MLAKHGRFLYSAIMMLQAFIVSDVQKDTTTMTSILRTTGIASVRILGYDSPNSLVCLSHRAPSKNRPLTYTPVKEDNNYDRASFTRKV